MTLEVAPPPSTSELAVVVRAQAVAIDELSRDDIDAAARMAVRLLPASLLCQLGESFMRALYRMALGHPATIALKATQRDGRPVGFCLASSDSTALQQQLRSALALPTVRALLAPSRHKLIPSFLRGILEPEVQPHMPAELLLLYVDEECQRKGSGRALVCQLEAELIAQTVPSYRVAVRSHLERAKAFYTATGFRFEQERMMLGEPMTYFIREL
jgi:ribosomal protein S18 acetylase RimI-like enzyme